MREDAKNGMKALASARSSMKRLGQLEMAGDYQGVLTLLSDLQVRVKDIQSTPLYWD